MYQDCLSASVRMVGDECGFKVRAAAGTVASTLGFARSMHGHMRLLRTPLLLMVHRYRLRLFRRLGPKRKSRPREC